MSEITQEQAVQIMQHLLAVGTSTNPMANARTRIAAEVKFKDVPSTVMLQDGTLVVQWAPSGSHEIQQQVHQLCCDQHIPAQYEFSRHRLTINLTENALQGLEKLDAVLKPAIADIGLDNLTREGMMMASPPALPIGVFKK